MQTKEMPIKIQVKMLIIKRVMTAALLLLAGASLFLTACGSASANRDSRNRPVPDAPLPESPDPDALPSDSLTQDGASQAGSPFHSVPYFRDDTGKAIQSLDGYLYGYWNGRLCSYDPDTLKESCYFSAVSDQSGQFCIYEGSLYFLERPHTSSLTNVDTCLYMVGLDGRERKLLTSQVPNSTREYINYDDYPIYYRIDIYDDIIYLFRQNQTDRVFYRLDRENDSVTRIPESETLYGLLPEGYTEPYRYSNLPSLPYQMRHYGYLLLMDADAKLAAYDVKSGRLEKIAFPTDSIAMDSVFLTHDALYCAEKVEFNQPLATWYRISLDDLQTAEVWGQFYNMQWGDRNEIFYDESGAYFVKKKGASVSLYQIPWDGSNMILLQNRYLEGGDYFPGPACNFGAAYAVDGGYFYFNDKKGSQYCMMRTPLHGASVEPQVVAAYGEESTETIFAHDTLEHNYTTNTVVDGEIEYISCETSLARLLLTEDTAGSHAINAYLEKVYGDIQQELEDFEADYLSDSESWPVSGIGSYMLVDAYSSYLDEHYVGITISTESYYAFAAHPNIWSEEYVFDRRTGKRIAITDLVENPADEICEIVSAYVEANHPGFRQGQDYRESILEDFRFFLTEEGFGFLYNTYELGSYVEGPDDYIIPFWEFDLKPDTITYYEPEKVRYQYHSWLEPKEPPLPDYIEELGNVLAEQLKAGTLPGFLEEHASSYRELSVGESLNEIAADQNGVLKQFYISGKQPGDQWLCLEDSRDIWIRQSCESEGTAYWKYYRFPHAENGYLAALDAISTCEEYFFLDWKNTYYLVTIGRNQEGDITAVSTHCLMADSVYNGWILDQTLEENGDVTVECRTYWM